MSGFQTEGINFDSQTADPGSPAEGEAWYNATDAHLKANISTGAAERVVLVTEKRTSVTLVAPVRVPNSGQQYLEQGGVATSNVPYRIIKSHTILRRLSIRVNAADPTNVYDVDVVQVGGSTLHSMELAATQTVAFEDLSVALVGPIELEFRLRRTSGSGESTFTQAWVEATFGE